MREIRRKDREISTRQIIDILKEGKFGVLSTVGDDGQPYGTPLNYLYQNEAIYFHCAVRGLKLDNIKNNLKVSFCVVGSTVVLPSTFGTEYESAIIFGRAAEIDGPERYNALVGLLEKYCVDYIEEGKKYIEKQDKNTKVIKITIEHISGKARKS